MDTRTQCCIHGRGPRHRRGSKRHQDFPFESEQQQRPGGRKGDTANTTIPFERRRTTSIASLVLPTPPGPVSVTRRDLLTSSRRSPTSRPRPMKPVNGAGSETSPGNSRLALGKRPFTRSADVTWSPATRRTSLDRHDRSPPERPKPGALGARYASKTGSWLRRRPHARLGRHAAAPRRQRQRVTLRCAGRDRMAVSGRELPRTKDASRDRIDPAAIPAAARHPRLGANSGIARPQVIVSYVRSASLRPFSLSGRLLSGRGAERRLAMATATKTPPTAPSPLASPSGLVPPPPASGREFLRCPEWHSLRLFGRGRRPAGLEIGSERPVKVL